MNYDYFTSAIKISIPTYSQSSKYTPGVVYFNIQLEVRDNKWYIQRRFSQFERLLNSLKSNYPNLPQLPQKTFLFKMTSKDLDARKQGLQEFLRKIIIRYDVMKTDLVKQFLHLDQDAAQMMLNLLVNLPKLHCHYNIQGQWQSKGIRDVFYIEQSAMMLVATTDVSPVNRINAKVTNTKLPWKTEGGKFTQIGSIQAYQYDTQSSLSRKLWSKGYSRQAICLAYDKTTKKILVGLNDGVIDIIKMTQNGYEDIICDKVHNSRVCGVGYDSLNNVVFSVSKDKIFRLSHGTSLAMILQLPHKQPLLSLFKDNINKRVFIGTKKGEILIYDVSQAQKPKLLNTLKNNKGGSIRSIFLDNNRNYLFSGSYQNGEINVFDLDKPGREKLANLNATLYGKQKIRAITWSAKRAEIMTGTADGCITFWNAVEGNKIYQLMAFDSQISRLDYLPQKNLLISASSKWKQILVWALPREWRDAKLVADQKKEAAKIIQQNNKSKLANTIKKGEEDSDDDDLAGWHLD